MEPMPIRCHLPTIKTELPRRPSRPVDRPGSAGCPIGQAVAEHPDSCRAAGSCSSEGMVQPGPDPDNYPPIDPSEPVPDDPGELSPDTPETLPPAPVEPMPGPDDPDAVPA